MFLLRYNYCINCRREALTVSDDGQYSELNMEFEPDYPEVGEAQAPETEEAPTEEVLQEKPKKKLKLKLLSRESFAELLKKLAKPQEKKKRRKRRVSLSLSKAVNILIVLLFCFLMITPLRSCVFSDSGFVDVAVAEEMAFADSGVAANNADNLKHDMIKLGEQMFYKVEFTSGINGYKYIVNANTGEIFAQAFYQLEKDGDSE